MKARTRTARKPLPATDRHLGVRVTPELAAALEGRRQEMLRAWPGATVTTSDVVRITLQRAIESEPIHLTPLTAQAAYEGAEREGIDPSAYVERLVLAAIPEAE